MVQSQVQHPGWDWRDAGGATFTIVSRDPFSMETVSGWFCALAGAQCGGHQHRHAAIRHRCCKNPNEISEYNKGQNSLFCLTHHYLIMTFLQYWYITWHLKLTFILKCSCIHNWFHNTFENVNLNVNLNLNINSKFNYEM